MPDKKIRHHLRLALAEAVKAEKQCLLNNGLACNINLVETIEKMKPLLKLLGALKMEIGDVEGLAILPYPNGDGVTITTEIYQHWLYGYIKHYGNSGFKYYEEGLQPEDGFYFYSDSAEEIMARVIDRVGRHICALRAQSGFNPGNRHQPEG